MRSILFHCLIFILIRLPVSAQNSAEVLTFDAFMQQLKANHPMALQAKIQKLKGEARMQASRGGFDPNIQAELAQKYFNDSEYYDLAEGKMNIPTWFGVELEAGYERNDGRFMNPENTTPDRGLWVAGISVPLGQGLFIDQRRAALRKAEAFLEQSTAEQNLMLNQLFLEAGMSYWKWFQAYQNYLVYQEAVELAETRFQATIERARLGDIPQIDTVEAGIQLQNRQLNLQEATLQFNNRRAELSTFLWKDGFIPLELDSNVRPEPLENVIEKSFQLPLQPSLDSLLNNHPRILQTLAKIKQQEVEKRWKSEQIKPKLNLKYQPITEAFTDDPFQNYTINDYTWGFQFEFPIFLRKERGELNLAKLQLNETQMELQNKRVEIKFKLTAALNEFNTSREQFLLYQKTTRDYLNLLEGERELFRGGESSLFMVNSREMGYINARIRLNQLISKNQKAVLKFKNAAGILD